MKVEFLGNFSILQAIAQETHDIFLSFGQQPRSACINDTHGRKLCKRFQYVRQFAAVRPDLPRVYTFHTLAEHLEDRPRGGKDALNACTEGVKYEIQFWIVE